MKINPTFVFLSINNIQVKMTKNLYFKMIGIKLYNNLEYWDLIIKKRLLLVEKNNKKTNRIIVISVFTIMNNCRFATW